MKNQLKLISISTALFIVFLSFTKGIKSDAVGVYGDEIMELVLNEDYTFTFKSTFDSENKIIQKGNWEMKRGKAFLRCENPNSALPIKWTFTNEGKTIKSRNKFVFYTLQKDSK